MPKYQAKQPLYVGGKRIPKGETFSSDSDKPGLQWEPLDKEAKERSTARLADYRERRAAKAAKAPLTGWSRQFEQNMIGIADDAPSQAHMRKGKKAA